MPASQTARAEHRATDKLLSNATFWEHCSTLFGKELPKQQFDTWIKPLTLRDAADAPESSVEAAGVIELVAPNRFVQQWIKDRYVQRLESLALEYWGTATRISVTYTPAVRKSAKAVDLPSFADSYQEAEPDGMRATRPGHLHARAQMMDAVEQGSGGEMSPNGNTVSLEHEMVKSVDIRQQHDMAMAVYRSTSDIIRASLGRR